MLLKGTAPASCSIGVDDITFENLDRCESGMASCDFKSNDACLYSGAGDHYWYVSKTLGLPDYFSGPTMPAQERKYINNATSNANVQVLEN